MSSYCPAQKSWRERHATPLEPSRQHTHPDRLIGLVCLAILLAAVFLL